MAPDRNRVRLVLEAREENVALARTVAAQVAAALDFTLPELEELRIAVSEAVSNAVLHAYPAATGDEAGEVEVAIALRDGAVSIDVRDTGRGIEDVATARRADYSTLEGHLGLGFAFMEAMTDELEVETTVGRGTCVRFVKRPHGPETADPASG